MLYISDNKRFLVNEDSEPFFYLGDTAWELFHRLDRTEADFYLHIRAEQKFTVIQAVVLAEIDGLTVPNPYGHVPLHNNDPARPVEAYFEHVDYIVDRANTLGLHIGMLPTWGDKVNNPQNRSLEIFTPENAEIYGRFIGNRYKEKDIIWILGGDRQCFSAEHFEIWRAMARGITIGDGGAHLKTWHPRGNETSSRYFHSEDWLGFNMLQSGHEFNKPNYISITQDYNLYPAKPCLDGEPGYEDIPSGFRKENRRLGQYDVRKAAYWALFAGAHGHTYGCHSIWQMYDPCKEREYKYHPGTPWKEAVNLFGSSQMKYARALLESRPFLTRIPDQSILLSPEKDEGEHLQATRSSDGSYAMVYSPIGASFEVNLEKLRGVRLKSWWYDPRTGIAIEGDILDKSNTHLFTPPDQGMGRDWILVLDDIEQQFGIPGK